MDSQQAREILAAYRPGTDDAADPYFAEALAHLGRDSALARWFENQCAADAALRAKFKEIEVPADLHARILSESNVIRPTAWWKLPTWLATAAAAVLVLAAVTAIWFRTHQPTPLDSYRTEMAQFVTAGYKMTLKSTSLQELQQMLALKRWPADYSLPRPLESVPLAGGAALTWEGHKVSMLCFEPSEDHYLWFFAMDRAALPEARLSEEPRFARVDKLMTAAWSSGDKTYLLAAEGSESSLRKYY